MEIFKEWFIGHIGSNPVIHGLIGGLVAVDPVVWTA